MGEGKLYRRIAREHGLPVWLMLELFPSSEITELLAIYLIEDEEAKKK